MSEQQAVPGRRYRREPERSTLPLALAIAFALNLILASLPVRRMLTAQRAPQRLSRLTAVRYAGGRTTLGSLAVPSGGAPAAWAPHRGGGGAGFRPSSGPVFSASPGGMALVAVGGGGGGKTSLPSAPAASFVAATFGPGGAASSGSTAHGTGMVARVPGLGGPLVADSGPGGFGGGNDRVATGMVPGLSGNGSGGPGLAIGSGSAAGTGVPGLPAGSGGEGGLVPGLPGGRGIGPITGPAAAPEPAAMPSAAAVAPTYMAPTAEPTARPEPRPEPAVPSEPAPAPRPEPQPEPPATRPQPVPVAEPEPAAEPKPKPEPKPEPKDDRPNLPVLQSRAQPDFPSVDKPVSVTVAIHVDASGHVSSVEVTKSSGIGGVDAAAKSAARRFSFSAARQGKTFNQTFRVKPE